MWNCYPQLRLSLTLIHHGVGRARCLRWVFGRTDGGSLHLRLAQLEDGRGEIVPGGYAFVAVVVDAVLLALRFNDGENAASQVDGIARRAHLVPNNA